MIDPHHTALRIAEDALFKTDAAIMTGSFDAFADCFLLPHAMEINGASHQIDSRAALEEMFQQFQKHLTLMRVTLLERHCISAEFVSETLISTTHETRLVCGRELVARPYPVFSELHLQEERWLIGSSRTAFPGDSELGDIGQETQKPLKSRPNHQALTSRRWTSRRCACGRCGCRPRCGKPCQNRFW